MYIKTFICFFLVCFKTFIGINIHPKRIFFIMCPTKKGNRKGKERQINKATKTFQRKISVEGVNE